MSEQTEGQPGLTRALIAAIKQEVGENDELVKQCLADINALERQNSRNHFESRMEYVRQLAERDFAARRGIVDYGLQTLKWLFLLNAGALAIVAAYIGGGLGKSGSSISSFAPLLKALWPFVMGCVMVALAGGAGYFNFAYLQTSLPSPEALHNFMDPKMKTWPVADATYSRKVDVSRKVAISFAFVSAAFFLYGVYRVLRAALP
jgi:hypothetical protein